MAHYIRTHETFQALIKYERYLIPHGANEVSKFGGDIIDQEISAVNVIHELLQSLEEKRRKEAMTSFSK